MSKNFHTDLKNGKKAEKIAGDFLIKVKGAKAINTRFAGSSHDFVLEFQNKQSTSYEIKADFVSDRTRNLFLEIECSGKPSGLKTTKSDKWAILIDSYKTILEFCPMDMLNWLSTANCKLVKGGDNYRARGYIVPIAAVMAANFVMTYRIT